MRFYFAFSLLIFASCAFAQKTSPNIVVTMMVSQTNYTDESVEAMALDDFKVVIMKDGKRDRVIRARRVDGDVVFNLQYGHLYRLEVRRRGLCCKMISVSTKGATELMDSAGFELELSFSLHPDLNRAQKRFLRRELIGKASYWPSKQNIIFDFDYTKAMKAKLKSLGDQ